MRVFAYIAAVVVSTLLVMLGAVAIALQGGPDSAIVLGGVGIGVLAYGSIVLGSLSAYWSATSSADSLRHFRRWLVVIGSLDLVAVALVIVWAVLSDAPAWLPVVIIAVGVGLAAAAIPIGRAVLRRERAAVPVHEDEGNPSSVRRRARPIVLAFAITLVAGGVLFGVLLGVLFGTRGLLDAVLFAFVFAFITAAIVAIVVSRTLLLELREAAGRDLGLAHKLARVVLKDKSESLSEAEQHAATRYARVAPAALGFQLVSFGLLYAGIALQQLEMLRDGDSPFGWILPALLVGIFAVFAPVTLARIGRARTYARTHPHTAET